MERNKKRAPWSQQEIALIGRLYPQLSSKKWKKMAEELRRQGFRRSEIEVRERWVNFEDPSVNKTRWEEAELARLFDIHDQVGTKWCVIQKYIGRTQNMIKNRFYGTLRNFVRFLVNQLGSRKESFNRRISRLSPKILNDIYKADHQFKFIGDEVKEAIYAMRFKIDKTILAERFKAKRPLYDKLKTIVCKIFEEMKAVYEDYVLESEAGELNEEEEEEERQQDRVERLAERRGENRVKQEQVKEEAEEAEEAVEEREESSELSSAQEVKAESVEEVYPFLEKEAEEMKFKVDDRVFYPFLSYCNCQAFDRLYKPLSTHYSLD